MYYLLFFIQITTYHIRYTKHEIGFVFSKHAIRHTTYDIRNTRLAPFDFAQDKLVFSKRVLTTKGTKITKRNNIEDPDPSGINNTYQRILHSEF